MQKKGETGKSFLLTLLFFISMQKVKKSYMLGYRPSMFHFLKLTDLFFIDPFLLTNEEIDVSPIKTGSPALLLIFGKRKDCAERRYGQESQSRITS